MIASSSPEKPEGPGLRSSPHKASGEASTGQGSPERIASTVPGTHNQQMNRDSKSHEIGISDRQVCARFCITTNHDASFLHDEVQSQGFAY